MVKSSKGSRSRTRGVMTKSARTRGVLSVTRHLQHFEPGDRVILRLEPSWHKGQPHPRYQGRVCIVVAKVGRAYRLEFLDGHKHKELIALPIHLLRADQPAGAK